MTGELNPFAIAQAQLDKAAEVLQLEPGVHQLLRLPLRELHVTLPVKMDDGSTRVLQGFRVQYNDARGPTKGGISFHPDCRRLAFETRQTGAEIWVMENFLPDQTDGGVSR